MSCMSSLAFTVPLCGHSMSQHSSAGIGKGRAGMASSHVRHRYMCRKSAEVSCTLAQRKVKPLKSTTLLDQGHLENSTKKRPLLGVFRNNDKRSRWLQPPSWSRPIATLLGPTVKSILNRLRALMPNWGALTNQQLHPRLYPSGQ